MNEKRNLKWLSIPVILILLAPFAVLGDTYDYTLNSISLTDDFEGEVRITSTLIEEDENNSENENENNSENDNENGNGEDPPETEEPSTDVTIELRYSPDTEVIVTDFTTVETMTETYFPEDHDGTIPFAFNQTAQPGVYYARASIEGSEVESDEIIIRDESPPVISLDFDSDRILSTASDNDFTAFLTDGFQVTLGNGLTYSYDQVTGTLPPFLGSYDLTYDDSMRGLAGSYTVEYSALNNAEPGTPKTKDTVTREITILPPPLSVQDVFNTWESAKETGERDLQILFDNPFGGFTFTRPVENAKEQTATVRVLSEMNEVIHQFTDSSINPLETRHVVNRLVPGTYRLQQIVNGEESAISDPFTVTDTTLPYFIVDGHIFVSGPDDIEEGRREFIKPSLFTEFNDELTRDNFLAGITARDNLDREINRNEIIIDDSSIDYSSPGRYEITYTVMSSSGNEQTVSRNVFVIPPPPNAIGTLADIGRVDVTQVITGFNANLYLYRYQVTGSDSLLYPFIDGAEDSIGTFDNFDIRREDSETTFNFFPSGFDDDGQIPGFINNRLEPGSYYVRQVIKVEETQVTDGVTETEDVILKSPRSNIVDILEQSQPMISLLGERSYSFVYDTDVSSIWTENTFSDPGAVISDYLYGDNIQALIGDENYDVRFEITKNGRRLTSENDLSSFSWPDDRLDPGNYTLTYRSTVRTNNESAPVSRSVTVAPYIIEDDAISVESSNISIGRDGMFPGAQTEITLYNANNQVIDRQIPHPDESAVFTGIPSGSGYYVTQTVNDVESAPSDPIRVRRHRIEPVLHSLTVSTNQFRVAGLITQDETNRQIKFQIPERYFADSDTITVDAEALFDGDSIQIGDSIYRDSLSGFQLELNRSENPDLILQNEAETAEYRVQVEPVRMPGPPEWEESSYYHQLIGSLFQSPLLRSTQMLRNQGLHAVIHNAQNRVAVRINHDIIQQAAPGQEGHIRSYSLPFRPQAPNWYQAVDRALELRWPTENQPFIQPAELTKQSEDPVTLIRIDSVQSPVQATALPGYHDYSTIDGSYAALNSFSSYAWIDRAYIPRLPVITGTGPYQVFNREPETAYYWTQDSAQIDFVRSMFFQEANGYSIRAGKNPASEWHLITDDTFTVPEDKTVYLVSKRDGLFSTVRAFNTPEPERKEADAPVGAEKIWTIELNGPISRHTLNDRFIYVENTTTGHRKPVTLSVDDSAQHIQVIPKTPYSRGEEYRLIVDHTIMEEKSRLLSANLIHFYFTIR